MRLKKTSPPIARSLTRVQRPIFKYKAHFLGTSPTLLAGSGWLAWLACFFAFPSPHATCARKEQARERKRRYNVLAQSIGGSRCVVWLSQTLPSGSCPYVEVGNTLLNTHTHTELTLNQNLKRASYIMFSLPSSNAFCVALTTCGSFLIKGLIVAYKGWQLYFKERTT